MGRSTGERSNILGKIIDGLKELIFGMTADATRRFFADHLPKSSKGNASCYSVRAIALDRDLRNLTVLENKTRSLIVRASRRSQRDPSQAC
ncbi:unnamed protein product [Zymoseptoria tritici ST99CH_3D1]|nr:unnamed protein product [Zymoseptoria tritici ST99CH_3D1]